MGVVYELQGWRSGLQRDPKTAALYPTSGNAMLYMDNDPALRGMLAYDELADRAVLMRAPPVAHTTQSERAGPYPRPWQAPDAEMVLAYLQHECPRFARETIRASMTACATTHRFHPVRDWLATLTWDGKERCAKWLQATFGAPDTPYVRAVGRAFLVAAVRRIMRPGCKFDHMLVLEGRQGLGKSTALCSLFSAEWFTDRLPRDLDSPDAIRAMLGKWCVEMPENDQIIRGGVETIKAFLSRSTDRIVPKYENEARDIPRQCVVVGTSNRDDYLRDATGNRRFWPIACETASPYWLEASRDQLWAEAAALEASGEDIWLTDPDIRIEAEALQAERVAEDTWLDILRDWSTTRSDLRMADILSDGLGIPRERHDRKAQMRAGDCLRRLGWHSVSAGRAGQGKGRVWRRNGVDSVENGEMR